MTQLFAQPFDRSAKGFYFEDYEQYFERASVLKNDYGDPVEELELQWIDGDDIDCDLAKAWGVNQANLKDFFDALVDWDERQKIRYIIAVGECGYSHEQVANNPDDIDIDIYELNSLKELAYEFVEEGLFGDIPERLQGYLDYEAIARDLSMDYSEITFNGTNLIYRCG